MKLRTLITALTLLAVAAHPLYASLRPCCCSQQLERPKSCCQSQQKKVSGLRHSCCGGQRSSSGKSDSVPYRGCCCIKASPAANLVQVSSAKPNLEKQQLEVVAPA